MAAVFPPLMQKIVTQYANRNRAQIAPSVQGFIIAEANIQNRPDLKLFCAFVKNWSSDIKPKPDNFDCNCPEGRARVAQIVGVCLAYMPLQNQDFLIRELTNWLACRVAESNIPNESWFSKSFVSLVNRKRQERGSESLDANQNQGGSRESAKKEFRAIQSNIDMTFVRPQTVATTREVQQEKPAETGRPVELRTPQARAGRKYQYGDRSTDFYKNTYNKYAEPQAILIDAQQQLVHGTDHYILQAAEPGSTQPSQYEKELQKTAHIRSNELNLPYHDRIVSAPNIRRRMEHTLNNVKEFSQPGVYLQLDEQMALQDKQRIYQLEIDKEVNNAARAYTDGRNKARAIVQQQMMQRRVGADGTTHMNDINEQTKIQYFNGTHRQIAEVHDIDTQYPPNDRGVDRAHDGLLDKDDDFTGLGIGSLNEALLRAQIIEEQQSNNGETDSECCEEVDENEHLAQDEPEDTQTARPEGKHTEKSGYLYRRAATNRLLSKITIPQYDIPIKPLEKVPDEGKEKQQLAFLSQDQIMKTKLVSQQRDLLEGGKNALDPRIYQATRAAASLFPNEELFIRSESDDLQDSEPSDAGAELRDNDQLIYLRRRSSQISDYKARLHDITSISTQPSDTARLLQQMQGSKAKVIRAEQLAFEQSEQERIKAIKKKQMMNQTGEKPKEPKRKVFKSEVEKQMATTTSGAPSQIEQLVKKERRDLDVLKQTQLSAQQVYEQLDDIETKDRKVEEEYYETAKKEQRQTFIHDALNLAFIQAQKETTTKFNDQVKAIVGNALLGDGNLTEEQSKSLELLGLEKENFMQVNQHNQMPYVYSKPLVQEALQKIENRVVEVTPQDHPNADLNERTYLPVQPNNSVANSTRAAFLQLARQNQNKLVADMDDIQPINDLQQSTNKLQNAAKPQTLKQIGGKSASAATQNNVFTIQPPACKEDAELEELRNPANIKLDTAREQLSDIVSGNVNVLARKDAVLVHRQLKREEEIDSALRGSKEGAIPPSYQDKEVLESVQTTQNGLGYDPVKRVVKSKKKKTKGKKNAKK